MADGQARHTAEAALEQLLETIKRPRALVLRPEERVVLEQAVERTRAQLLGTPEPVLTVALAGGTGAGKSTLINALAGAAVAESGLLRPTTTTLRVYHHRDVASGGLPVELAAEAAFVPHDRARLRTKVLVDTPDLDSFATHHRTATRALLKAAGLVLYVFSPQSYRDERTWSVLREERRFSACAAVLNKIDLVGPEELEAITEDLRRAFARLGLPEIRIFRTIATAHVGEGRDATTTSAADDLVALRAFLEHELQSSDIVRLRQRQRARVLEYLKAEIERVAPTRLLDQLDEATVTLPERIERAAARLHGALAEPLAAAQAALAPRATLRQHERFWGPFRTWLAVTDMLRFGLPGLLRRILSDTPKGDVPPVELLTSRATATAADLLRDEAYELQSLLYTSGLPIDRWRTVTARADGSRLMADVAAWLEHQFDAAAEASAARGGAIVWTVSTLGRLVPAAFVVIGLYVMGRDLLAGTYLGLPLLGHLFAMLILTFLTLQGVASLFLPSRRQRRGSNAGRQAVLQGVSRTMTGWIGTYRGDLEADLTELRAAVSALQSAPGFDHTPDDPTPRARGPAL